MRLYFLLLLYIYLFLLSNFIYIYIYVICIYIYIYIYIYLYLCPIYILSSNFEIQILTIKPWQWNEGRPCFSTATRRRRPGRNVRLYATALDCSSLERSGQPSC